MKDDAFVLVDSVYEDESRISAENSDFEISRRKFPRSWISGQ